MIKKFDVAEETLNNNLKPKRAKKISLMPVWKLQKYLGSVFNTFYSHMNLKKEQSLKKLSQSRNLDSNLSALRNFFTVVLKVK